MELCEQQLHLALGPTIREPWRASSLDSRSAVLFALAFPCLQCLAMSLIGSTSASPVYFLPAFWSSHFDLHACKTHCLFFFFFPYFLLKSGDPKHIF